MYEASSVVERDDLFNRMLREQWAEQLGRRLDVLAAGCGRAAPLAVPRTEIKVIGIDEDLPVLRRAVERRTDLDTYALGDLRLVPVPPRSFDVVHAEFVLERVRHAELILDRLLAGLRPGGLLLIKMRDRASAYGFLDRILPFWLRRLLWRRFTPPGVTGPLPACYETVTSREGLRSFCLSRGLRISAERIGTGGPALAGPLGGLTRAACALVHLLTGGRLPATHDEVTFVIRKPQNQFARLI